eukprot:364221-Chlamydomonas_euryale.AAC.10
MHCSHLGPCTPHPFSCPLPHFPHLEQHVARRQVAVDDALGVDVDETTCYVTQQAEDEVEVGRLGCAVQQQL